MVKKTKIVATLGPSSNNEEIIECLIKAGIDVARLNFSHGTHKSHGNIIKILRKLSKKINKPITILQDLQGPKLRVDDLGELGLSLLAGENVKLINHKLVKDYKKPKEKLIPIDIPDIFRYLHKGSKILLDDGKLELEVLQALPSEIDAKVVIGGMLYSNKGINLPGTNLGLPGFTQKDREDLEFGLQQGIDAVAISFVKDARDIQIVRETIKAYSEEKADTPIIAKLELPQAIQNLAEILDSADGVMVARGDLGVETYHAFVPIVQKEIIQSANLKAKLVITATQMLDSMINNPQPTRAEASDVANAIFDGSDAVMLSGETASGSYPIESVKMMGSIITESESHFEKWGQISAKQSGFDDDAFAISFAARELAHERSVAAIAVFTQSGRSAIFQSKARPNVPILAFTPHERTYKRLGLYWGVTPHLVPFSTTLEDMITHVESTLLNYANIKIGQKVVLVSGFPIGAMRPTNLALIHTIGSIEK